jgi:hypothetical protein
MKCIVERHRVLQIAAILAGLFIAGSSIVIGRTPVLPAQPQVIRAERYLTHISTDKPIYRSGERIYFRGVILRADGHTPLTNLQNQALTASFEIKGPKGETVASGFSTIVDSVAGFSWDIPASQPGGEYTVRISHPLEEVPAERKFDIRAYRTPRLKSQIVFGRDGYGPGDTVVANLHVERAEGGAPNGAKVSVSARVDGAEIWRGAAGVDSSGNASVNFKLPSAIARGEGVIAMTIEDGGAVETAAKTIPILLQTIDLAIYPEGGDLIAGLPNRVYVEGRTPAGKPADMAGVIVNAGGKEVAVFRTEHEGRGRFSFVPAKRETYSLRLTEPAGIKKSFPLPPVKESGLIISSVSDVTPRQKDIVVRVAATTAGAYRVVLSQRGREITFKNLTLAANQTSGIGVPVQNSIDGVIVATIYDDSQTPIAERLIFREPQHHLRVQIAADRADYVPGDKVTLRITTSDDKGKPIGAVVGLAVTDSSVLEMIDKREQAPRLPVMVLLESEVRDLADAHIYLDETNPKAMLATDLLLGTQGWRRFVTAGSGSFNGLVTDVGKARIPGVAVRAVHTITGTMFTTVSNEKGEYAFPGVNAGAYRVSASLPGFQTKTHSVLVAHKSSVQQDIELAVAALAIMAQVAEVGRPFPPGLPVMAAPVVAEMREGNLAVAHAAVDRFEPGNERQALQDAMLPGQRAGGVFGMVARAFARKEAAVNALTIREYAHTLRPNWAAGERTDFTETVYWHAGIKTNASSGLATVSFNLSDAVTSFRVLADAFSDGGVLGSGVSHIESVKPFSIEPKVPLQVTSGDVIDLPIAVINGLHRDLGNVKLLVQTGSGIKFSMLGNQETALRAKERMRRFVQLGVGNEFSGLANLTLDANTGPYRDTVTRTLDVRPQGFPGEISKGGSLERNGVQSFEFTLPAGIVRGSVSTSVTVYPTPLANMTDALQSLLREPYGCFEQTSATSYPMVMAQQYFLTHTGIDPTIVQKARDLLDVSYKKLTGFETPTKGYEWFGADPGHEALSAYGLMQFTDMSQVRTVDQDMMARTRAWLLSRRDGNGGFRRNSRALDSFGGAPADTTNAYIVWALIESGEKGLGKEVAAVKAASNSTEDSYVIALAANSLHASGDHAGARQLMDKLARSQDAAGNVKGAATSITRSGGVALDIETTALSVLAWMREPVYASNVEKGIMWIIESNKSGRFGSTQSTILALRSIIAYDAAHARPKAPGRLVLVVDGKTVGSPVAFTANTQGALLLPEFANTLGPGKHRVELKMEDGSRMPFSIGVKYHSILPDSASEAQVGIQVELKDREIQEGGVTEAMISITNKSNQVLPTPVAIVGVPGGLEVRHDQLKELVKSGRIDAYEVNGRDVVLYWRYLKAKDQFDLPLSLVAAVPGSYTGPASRAYLYYTDEYKNWAPGLKVDIRRR